MRAGPAGPERPTWAALPLASCAPPSTRRDRMLRGSATALLAWSLLWGSPWARNTPQQDNLEECLCDGPGLLGDHRHPAPAEATLSLHPYSSRVVQLRGLGPEKSPDRDPHGFGTSHELIHRAKDPSQLSSSHEASVTSTQIPDRKGKLQITLSKTYVSSISTEMLT